MPFKVCLSRIVLGYCWVQWTVMLPAEYPLVRNLMALANSVALGMPLSNSRTKLYLQVLSPSGTI